MTTLQTIDQNAAQKEVLINQNFSVLSNYAALSTKPNNVAGLRYNYFGGKVQNPDGSITNVEDGFITITASPSEKTTYVEYNVSTNKVESNEVGFSTGNYAMSIIKSVNVITSIENNIYPNFQSFNTEKGGGGGGGGGNSYISIFDYKQDDAMSFSIKGGQWFSGGKAIYDTTKTVADYTNIYEINLEPNSTYRVVYDYVYNTINTLLLASTDVGPSTKTSKFLYIIKTDDTKISEVHDYRKYDLFVNNSVFVSALDLTSSTKTYRFSFDFLNELMQEGSKSTVKNAWRNIYPQLSRPSFCLLCISDDAGYWSSDEADFVTSSNKTKPWKFQKLSGSYDVYVDDDIYVFNPDAMEWQVINYEKWQLIIKLELELH